MNEDKEKREREREKRREREREQQKLYTKYIKGTHKTRGRERGDAGVATCKEYAATSSRQDVSVRRR